jgi:hypothetical protein
MGRPAETPSTNCELFANKIPMEEAVMTTHEDRANEGKPQPGGMLSPRTFLRAVVASAGAALLAACGGATTTLGVYLSRVYAAASVPDELLEAARIDGSGEVRTFESLAQA